MTFPNQNGADFSVTAKVDGKIASQTVSVTNHTYTTTKEEKVNI